MYLMPLLFGHVRGVGGCLITHLWLLILSVVFSESSTTGLPEIGSSTVWLLVVEQVM